MRGLFLENHDLPRFASEIRAPDVATATTRQRIALAVIATTPGIPQLYAGTELGMEGAWPENRRDMPGWAFDPGARTPHAGYLGDPGETFSFLSALLHLRREEPALHLGGYVELWRPGGWEVPLYAFVRVHGARPVIVTLATGPVHVGVLIRDNPELDAATKALFSDGLRLIERLGRAEGASAVMVDGRLELDLPAGGVAIWSLSE
jgi:glycosidase